jgi:2TM domain
MSTIPEEKLIQIKNRIHKKVKFYNNLGAYLIVCTFLTFLDYFDLSRVGVFSIDWVYWVWLGWGVGLAFNYRSAFVNSDFEDKMIQKELDKETKK